MTKIPEHWTLTTISEVTEKIESTDPRKSPTCQFAYVDIGAIDNVSRKIVAPKTFPGAEAPSRARRVISEGDTLFSTVRTYLRNIAQVPAELDGQLTSTGIAVLRPGKAVAPDYLFKWVQHSEFVDEISKSQDGTMYPAVSDGDVAGGPIPLPPIPEQRRIVAKLDRLSTRSAAARDHLTRTTKLATRAKQAILAEVFRDANGTAEDYIESTFYGPRFAKTAYVREGIPTLRTTDFRADGVIQLGDAPMVEVSEKEMSKWGLADGDLLVTRTGSIGKSAVYEKEMGPALPSAYLIRVRLNLAKADPWFVYYAFASPEGQRFLGASATAITQPNVNAKAIRTVPVPLLELQAQKEIVRRIEAAFARIDRMTEEASRAAHLLDRLDERLLAKAFRGELVPQDPDDEPAEALLTRIREARAAAPKAKRGRRKKAEA